MRSEFAKYIEKIALKDDRIIFLTGDLGFMAFESLQDKLGKRFINAGVAEQNMISTAAGLAKQGFLPFVYSIAPFVTYRCFEQIRNDIMFHNLPVTIVGNGGGYGYGIMGATHHAIEDYGIMAAIGIKSHVPMLNSDVEKVLAQIIKSNQPAYLRLNYGNLDDESCNYSTWRNFLSGDKITIVTIGSVGIEAYNACRDFHGKIDFWNAAEFPFDDIPENLIKSIEKTGNLICVEEHVRISGFGENFVCKLLEKTKKPFNFQLCNALRYPSKTYGSQQFHRKESGIDEASIKKIILEFLNEKNNR